MRSGAEFLSNVTFIEEDPAPGPSVKVINRLFEASPDKKSPTLDMEMVPTSDVGLVFFRETDPTPGAAAMEPVMDGPSRMGASAAPPIKPRRELISAVVFGSRVVKSEISAAPPSLTVPLILAEQEKKTADTGITNNKNKFFRLIIV